MVLDDLGEEVGWEAPLEVVEEVVRTFARMQVEAAGHVVELLAAGCHDRRLDRLAAQARAWLPAIGATGALAGVDDATWLSEDEQAAVRAALSRGAGLLRRAGRPRRPALDRPRRPAPGQRGQGTGRLPVLRLDRRLRRPSVLRPADPPARHRLRRDEGDGELRDRLRAAYLPAWAAFEPPGRLARALQLAAPLGALHHAVSYRSLVAGMTPPVESHMAGSTAWWLRQMLAGLGDLS